MRAPLTPRTSGRPPLTRLATSTTPSTVAFSPLSLAGDVLLCRVVSSSAPTSGLGVEAFERR
eukprot:3514899-Rhodomonas_salina.4